jgi:hypothetical protein
MITLREVRAVAGGVAGRAWSRMLPPTRTKPPPPVRGMGTASARTLGGVLRHLRDHDGRPTAQVRLIALLAVVGLVALSAPAIVSVVRWIADLVW